MSASAAHPRLRTFAVILMVPLFAAPRARRGHGPREDRRCSKMTAEQSLEIGGMEEPEDPLG